MTLEVHYRGKKLFRMACCGIAFAVLGVWMALWPDGSFDDSRKIRSLAALLGGNSDLIGHGIGWLCALMGVGGLAIAFEQMRFQGPAIRINRDGIYYHRWSPKPIGWGNVAGIKVVSIYSHKMICLTLRNPSLDPSTTFFGLAGRLNGVLGFGQVSISAEGTDTDFDELARAIFDHADLHERAKHDADPTPSQPSNFGRRRVPSSR